ncbi:MAG: UDP-glucose 4-epimerase GalE [Oscillospiraceae bacterium]|jgi:UDP-glucose 4-epimerase|nr:UDP-glucose 4-epimerase GalE [Oscillospiraceae bacterium]
MKILVTGGTGYIGSHTCVELLKEGHAVVILDNLRNSKAAVLEPVAALGGGTPVFVEGDMRDRPLLDSIFARHAPDAVIHFAGLKCVPESILNPLDYYNTNLYGTVTLLEAMQAAGCKNFVFSSSATVYGSKNSVPFHEEMPTGTATNPYGTTKIMIEQILRDYAAAQPAASICLLRYFNPVGAHPSGKLGESPNGVPNNIMPLIADVARGRLPALQITGTDFETPDGTGVRDYIHVVDLALGHMKALEKICGSTGVSVYNLGTGKGVSVLELVRAFEQVSGVTLPKVFAPCRPGDVAVCYADTSKAARELGWKAQRSVDDMCRDTWNYSRLREDLIN